MTVGQVATEAKGVIEDATEEVVENLQAEIEGDTEVDDGGEMWTGEGGLSQSELMDAVLQLNMFSQASSIVDKAVANDETSKVNFIREAKV